MPIETSLHRYQLVTYVVMIDITNQAQCGMEAAYYSICQTKLLLLPFQLYTGAVLSMLIY